MTLSRDADEIARLLADLDAEILYRLSRGPLRADSVAALLEFVDCALAGSRECMALGENARGWHESALSNTRAPGNYHAALRLSLAKYHASRGEHDEER